MFIVDSHCDSIATLANEKEKLVKPYNFSNKFPQLQLVAFFCNRKGESESECHRRALDYFGYFERAISSEDNVVAVKSYADIERALGESKHAALLSFEGGGAAICRDISVFKGFFERGVRVFGIAWLSNAMAKSNRLEENEEDSGLTEFGRQVVAEGNLLGMIFDCSHLSDKSFYDLMEISEKPVIASHSNLRKICPHSRNLTDDMVKLIVEGDGMIGLNLCRDFINENREKATVEGLFEHIDAFCALGAESHLGFGADIDGIGGDYPPPLDESSSIHDRLVEAMLAHGYPEKTVFDIAYGNYLRFFRDHLPK